jgi:hypothetical protein
MESKINDLIYVVSEFVFKINVNKTKGVGINTLIKKKKVIEDKMMKHLISFITSAVS